MKPRKPKTREERIRARMAALNPCPPCQLLGFACSLHRARAA